MKLALLAGFLVALGLAGILVSTIVRVNEHYSEIETDYGIILDAGSTATKAYIYEWAHKTTQVTPFVLLSMSKDNVPRTYKVPTGIASIYLNSTEVSKYLDPILDWAYSVVPHKKLSATPIFFQGTGGIRLLPEIDQNTLLTSVRLKLQDSKLKFDPTYASVLTGTQEAGYGFLAVNGLSGNFEKTGEHVLYGSLDMGGVSSEIAFSSKDNPENYTFTAEINGTLLTVYAKGEDGLGINEARYTLNASLYMNSTGTVIDPCAPFGYYENATIQINNHIHWYLLMGSSNYGACAAQIRYLVQQLTHNIPRPAIGSTRFITADHYLDVKKFYKLKDNANIVELQAKVESFCELDYGNALQHHNDFANDVQYFCFMGNYIVSLLQDFYGFDPTTRHILWKDSVKKAPLTWTYGSMLNYVEQIPADTGSQTKIRVIRFFRTAGGTVTLFVSSMLVVLGLVLYILQKRRATYQWEPIR